MIPPSLDKLVSQFEALRALRQSRALGPSDARRLALLEDTLLEANMLLSARHSPFPARSPRVAYAMRVSYRTREGAAVAVTRDIGTHGLCIETDRPLPKGSVVALELLVDGWSTPLSTAGEVVWASASAMGVALRVLTPLDEEKLRTLVAEQFNLKDALLGLLDLDKTPTVVSSIRPHVTGGSALAIGLTDPDLREASSALLQLDELLPMTELPKDMAPALIIADPDHAARLSRRYPDVPLVLVNANPTEMKPGAALKLEVEAYVRNPATPSAIRAAVQSVLYAPAAEVI